METLQQVYNLNELCNEEEVPEMAWIAVDQSLIGGKLRNFAKKSKISQNEAIGILVRLWLWALDNADQDGKIVAGDMSDVEEAIRAGFLSEEKERVSAITQNLLDCGWIDTKDGELILHDWTDWRSYYTALQKKEQSARNICGHTDQETGKTRKPKSQRKKNQKRRKASRIGMNTKRILKSFGQHIQEKLKKRMRTKNTRRGLKMVSRKRICFRRQ